MKINHISQAYGVEIQKAAGNNKAVSKDEKVKRSDSVDVSSKAQTLAKDAGSVETATTRVSGLPEIRWNKVDEVKQKLAEGFYNTETFKEELAERLIKDFGI